jgi:hypothetical protein
MVYRGQVALEEAAAPGQLARVGDQQPDLGAQRPPVRGRRFPGAGGCMTRRLVAPGRGPGRGGPWRGHHEPPEVTLPDSELDDGALADEEP